jgi:uncharacterized hydrophobic protein (TIGR00271 family)
MTRTGEYDERPPRLTALGTVTQWARRTIAAAHREPQPHEWAAVDELFPEGRERREFVFRFASLIALSASIAAFGLLADSSAVVIGAMLVAPLMTPITGAAAATVTARNDRLLWSAAVIVLGIVLAIAVGWAVAAVAGRGVIGPSQVPGEIRARTYPGLLDLCIAVAAGAAAGYIVPRRSATSALPGVGIAVALVPPLATVGITAQAGLSSDARNAFLLFLTNLAAILFAASVLLLAAGFRPRGATGRWTVPTRIAVTAIAVLAVAVPLAFHTTTILRENKLRSDVVAALGVWDPTVRVIDLDVGIAGGVADVDLLVSGQDPSQRVWRLAEEIRERFGDPVDLRLQYQQDLLFLVSAR